MHLVRVALAGLLAATPALAQHTQLVDVTASGAPPGAGALWPSLSRTGRHVAFHSQAHDLVPGDVNGFYDVFVRDMRTEEIELVSRSTSGAQGDDSAFFPSLSPDARYVAFASPARNFVSPRDVVGFHDVFLRDRTRGTTTKVSVSILGGETNGSSSLPDVSADGSRVCFESAASDVVAGDTNGRVDVFVRDLSAGTTTLVSRSMGGGVANDHSYGSSMSDDGRFVAFVSDASDIVAGDTNGESDVFVLDLRTGALVLASISSTGQQGNQYSRGPAISGDGRLVVFESLASNLVPGDSGGWQDIFLRDLALGTTTLVSKSASGIQADYSSFQPSISSDGRFAAFLSGAFNLTTPPTPHRIGMARVDLATGAVVGVAFSTCNVPIDQLITPALSSDGAVLAFASAAAHAAPEDVNNAYDVFLHDPHAPPAVPICAYCTTTPSSHGCLPTISASGTPSASAASGFVLSVGSVEGQRTALFFHGLSSLASPWGNAGRTRLCVGLLGRFGIQSSGGTLNQCDGSLSVDWNSARPYWAQAGDAVFVQAWFRDPPSVNRTHLSNAMSFVVNP